MNEIKVLISGASRGIGKYLFSRLISDGYKVYGTYNNTLPDKDILEFFEKVDIRDDNQLSEWVGKVVCQSDKIVLLNCAGTNYNVSAHKANPDKWMQLIDVNLGGTFKAINAVLPYMRSQGFGRIINFSSVVAQRGVAGTSAYAASKSALWGLTKSTAIENASKGITINCLNLGYFNIGMISDVPDDILQSIIESIPVKHLGDPINIYNAVIFLIKSDYITGTTLDINGGLF